jgi:endo-1,4-beta-xylanase
MLRRTCLRTLGAAACAALHAEEAPLPRLKDVAAKRNIQYGATEELNGQKPVPGYLDLFAGQCALLAPNLSSKSVWKENGDHDFSRFAIPLDFARAHSIRLTGAHLLWHESWPDWMQTVADPAEARRRAVAHIQFMARRFAGSAYSWNVINEAIEPRNGRPDGLRNTPLLKLFGDDLFDIAFRTAREADPAAQLVYNDYAIEMDTPDQAARRRALLGLLESFQKRKTPIDAVGLQTHLWLRNFKFQPELYRRFLKDLASFGVRIFITELDVFDLGAPSDIAARDQAVADAYRRVLEVALDEPAVSTLVTWGLSDRYTWITPRHSPRFAREDGLPSRPLPFDDQFQPKPAFRAIVRALESAPPRPRLNAAAAP